MLKNKHVLFICPGFYNYHTKIIEYLELNGATVSYINDKIHMNVFTNIICKLHITKRLYYNYKIRKEFKNLPKEIDYLFVIKGMFVNKYFKQKFIKNYSKAKRIMYQWDSLKNCNFLDNISFFHKTFSFDYKDSDSLENVNYLPLFHTNNSESGNSTAKKIDLSFVGTYKEDRYNFLIQIKKEAKRLDLSYFIHLYIAKHLYYKLKRKYGESFDPEILKLDKISSDDLNNIMNNSKATLDINSTNQSGLTIRTIESLACENKLITTNHNIVKEPIYNKNNFLVIDRENPKLVKSFFDNKTTQNGIEDYHIDKWIYKIFKEY